MTTATTRGDRIGSRIVPALVVGLYLSTIAVPRIIGAGGAVRRKLIVEALLFGLVLGGFGLVFLARGQVRFDRSYVELLGVFGLLVLLSTVALAVGFAHGHPTGDVLGDYYKFVVAPLTVLLVYAATDSTEQLETAFAVVFRVALVVFAVTLGLYLTGVLSSNMRPEYVYQFPLVLVVGYWLFARGDEIAKYGFPFLLLAAVPFVFYTQSLSLLVQVVLTGVLTGVYVRADELEAMLRVAVPVAVVGLLGGGLFVIAVAQVPASQWSQYGYLGSKMIAISGDYTLYERIVVLGGSRAAEPFGVVARIDDSFFQLIFGSGLGGTFVASSPLGPAGWAGEDHFVHAGLWEAVLRTGLLGGLAYLGMLLGYLYVGWRVSADSHLGALAAANATLLLALAPLTGKLLGPQFFSYALFAYALARWTELRES